MLLCPISIHPQFPTMTRIPIGIHMTGPRVFGMHTLDGSLQRANFSCLLWSIAKWCTLTIPGILLVFFFGYNGPKKQGGKVKRKGQCS